MRKMIECHNGSEEERGSCGVGCAIKGGIRKDATEKVARRGVCGLSLRGENRLFLRSRMEEVYWGGRKKTGPVR